MRDRRAVGIGQVDAAAHHGHARAGEQRARADRAGVDVARASDRDLAALRARRIGFVFQQFHLLEADSALENVANGLLYAGTPARERRRAARAALDRVGLGDRARPAPRRCCPGASASAWRSRARSSARRRSCSPTSRPATSTRATGGEILALLRALNAQGTTVLVITHDREIAATLPRRVELRDGRLIHDELAAPARARAGGAP